MLKVTILGCGSSGGVPMIGCSCPVCISADSKNKRTRVSIAVEYAGKRILIDTSPDMRAQCLRHGIGTVDAIIYTHAHADHMHGIDDARFFNYTHNKLIDVYADETTLSRVKEGFGYALPREKPANLPPGAVWYRPFLHPILIEPFKAFTACGIDVLPIAQKHGGETTLGLRLGSFAYSVDTNGLSEEAFAALKGIDTWVVDCLRYESAPTHAHLEMTLGWIRRVKPKRAYLTHMSHSFDYAKLAGELPEGVSPAFDGLVLEIGV